MSYDLVNGKLKPRAQSDKLDAPTPSQIAERAYDLAIERAVDAVESMPLDIPGLNLGAFVREYMRERQPDTLAALRESVINPGVIPWWRRP